MIVCSALILPINNFTLLAVIGVGGGLILFFHGFRRLARKRLLLNTPTSKIRSASLGLVEVSGLATGPYTMPAPITGLPCYMYRTTAWQQRESSKHHDWEKVAEETMHLPFFLDDNSGQLLVSPAGADLDLHRDCREEYSASFFSTRDDVPPQVRDFLVRHGVTPARAIRVEECCIKPKNFLFVMGTLAENSTEMRPLPAQNDREFTPTNLGLGRRPSSTPPPEVVRLSESTTSLEPDVMTQQSKIAAALIKAGISSPGAWAAAGLSAPVVKQAPQITEISVHAKPESAKPGPRSSSQLAPPVVLRKGENNPAFLISWRSQNEVAGSLAWKSAAMIWGGAGLTLLGLYVLLANLGML